MSAMSNEEAWLFAASWGSYMTSGDPGACMYGFDERFEMQSRAHRRRCIVWIRGCMKIVRENPTWYARNELSLLHRFRRKVRGAPLAA